MADTWQVTSQEQTVALNPVNHQLQDVMEVHFLITAGPAVNHAGKVCVPVASYTPENVRDLIDSQVAVMQGVADL